MAGGVKNFGVFEVPKGMKDLGMPKKRVYAHEVVKFVFSKGTKDKKDGRDLHISAPLAKALGVKKRVIRLGDITRAVYGTWTKV